MRRIFTFLVIAAMGCGERSTPTATTSPTAISASPNDTQESKENEEKKQLDQYYAEVRAQCQAYQASHSRLQPTTTAEEAVNACRFDIMVVILHARYYRNVSRWDLGEHVGWAEPECAWVLKDEFKWEGKPLTLTPTSSPFIQDLLQVARAVQNCKSKLLSLPINEREGRFYTFKDLLGDIPEQEEVHYKQELDAAFLAMKLPRTKELMAEVRAAIRSAEVIPLVRRMIWATYREMVTPTASHNPFSLEEIGATTDRLNTLKHTIEDGNFSYWVGLEPGVDPYSRSCNMTQQSNLCYEGSELRVRAQGRCVEDGRRWRRLARCSDPELPPSTP